MPSVDVMGTKWENDRSKITKKGFWDEIADLMEDMGCKRVIKYILNPSKLLSRIDIRKKSRVPLEPNRLFSKGTSSLIQHFTAY